jgi:hypothetical protein
MQGEALDEGREAPSQAWVASFLIIRLRLINLGYVGSGHAGAMLDMLDILDMIGNAGGISGHSGHCTALPHGVG